MQKIYIPGKLEATIIDEHTPKGVTKRFG